jgi:hypothetical protein
MVEEQAAALMQLHRDADHDKASKRVGETLQKAGYQATAAQVAKWHKRYKGKSNPFYQGLLKDTRPPGSDSIRRLMGSKSRAKALAEAIKAAERVLQSTVREMLGRKLSPH